MALVRSIRTLNGTGDVCHADACVGVLGFELLSDPRAVFYRLAFERCVYEYARSLDGRVSQAMTANANMSLAFRNGGENGHEIE